jgi:hypothetical protein
MSARGNYGRILKENKTYHSSHRFNYHPILPYRSSKTCNHRHLRKLYSKVSSPRPKRVHPHRRRWQLNSANNLQRNHPRSSESNIIRSFLSERRGWQSNKVSLFEQTNKEDTAKIAIECRIKFNSNPKQLFSNTTYRG